MWPQVPFIAHFDIFHIIKFNKIFDISQYMFVGQYIPTSTAASDINLFSTCNQLLFWKFENLFLGNALSRQKNVVRPPPKRYCRDVKHCTHAFVIPSTTIDHGHIVKNFNSADAIYHYYQPCAQYEYTINSHLFIPDIPPLIRHTYNHPEKMHAQVPDIWQIFITFAPKKWACRVFAALSPCLNV